MTELKYTIKDAQGIHARPAGMLVKEAASFPCSIMIEANGKSVDVKRILGVMSLGVKSGQEIILRADGEREEEAIATLNAFLEANL